jgi:hypothetical protein
MEILRSFLETRSVATFVAVLLAGVAPVDAQPAALADLHGLTPRQVRSESFTLPVAQDVRIEAIGAESAKISDRFSWVTTMWQRDARRAVPPWSGNAWILDLSDRKVVWELSTSATGRGARGAREFKGSVRLAAGSYTAYYAAFPDGEYWTDEDAKTRANRQWHPFGDEPVDEFKLVVRGNGRQLSANDVERLRQSAAASAVVVLRGTSGEQFQQAGFTLSKPTEVEVDVEGEAREDGEFDYGWIINADTRAKVWGLTYRDSDPAGGADKNRVARISRVLPAGRYAAFYATDDSHDPSQWNTQPPHDPDAWGLRIAVIPNDDRAAVRTFAYEHVPESATILALTRIGNSMSRKQGFTVTRPMDVRVYALGEGRDGRMFDYGWITSAGSRTRVWEMRYDGTEPAGGDRKNRLVDTTLHLQRGSYVVHYISDDSHSADEWNAAAPADGRHWGITVLAAQGALDRGAIAPYEEKGDPSILAQLTEIRDNDQVRKRFTLATESDVRIYAVGESSGRDMADYGWIEDARSGRRVWEMTYRITQHAGGASKNRRFDGSVRLPAGEYVVRYETDGSHAFGDWNAAPPDDPEMWGITIYRAVR